jgi:GntR family transcriptional regulator of arabinose operon
MAAPLYRQIIDCIIDKIEKGEYPYGTKIPTESQLADMFFVSRITSKRALDELAASDYVIRKKRTGTFVKYNAIKKAPPFSREGDSQSGRRTDIKMIGLVFPFDPSRYDGQKCINGVLNVANEHNCYTIIQNSQLSGRCERQIIEKMIGDSIDGIIYYPANSVSNFKFLVELEARKYPIVTIDKCFSNIDISSVVSENLSGSSSMTQYLIEMGHRNIGFVSDYPIEICDSLKLRYKGYLLTLSKHGIPANSKYIFEKKRHLYEEREGDASSDAYHKNRSLYSRVIANMLNEGVTAVQCPTDGIAYILWDCCEQMGIRIPDDLSISGFDDLPEKRNYQLTTVRQDLMQFGVRAANLLLEKMGDPDAPCENCILPVKLIERATVKNLNTLPQQPVGKS